jgi:hypothetical protein
MNRGRSVTTLNAPSPEVVAAIVSVSLLALSVVVSLGLLLKEAKVRRDVKGIIEVKLVICVDVSSSDSLVSISVTLDEVGEIMVVGLTP